MASLVTWGLSNAVVAAVLALVALAAGSAFRRPALTHALWVLVLVKLVTPPLVGVPVPGWYAPAEPKEPPAPVAKSEKVPPPAPRVVAAPPVEVKAAPLPAMGGMGAFGKIEDLAMGKFPRPGVVQPPAVEVIPPPAEEPDEDENDELEASPVPQAGPPPTPSVNVDAALAVVGWAWVGGALVWYALVVWRISSFQRLLRLATPAPDALQKEADELSRELGRGDAPRVFLVPGSLPPLLWALGPRPALYFPEALLPRLDGAGRATLLAHEMAHLARRDHWVRRLELVVGGLFWWYPLVYFASSRLRAAEEEACDAWVISELPGFNAAYAGALLETVDFLGPQAQALPPAASGIGRLEHLKRRLTMIVNGSATRGLTWIGFGVVALVFAALPLVPGRSPRPAEDDSADTPAVTPKDASKGDGKNPPVPPAPRETPDEAERFDTRNRRLQGGGGDVWAMAYSPDGKTLAVATGSAGDADGALTLFEWPAKKEIACVGSLKPVRCVAWSRDGKQLAAGDFEKKITLRDPKTGAVVRTFEGHDGSVNAVAFSPDGKTLYSAGLDATVRAWDVETGKNTLTLKEHTDWVLGLDVSADGKTLLSGSKDRTARIYDLPAGKLRHVLKGHTGWVENVRLSPDGAVAATCGHDRTVRLWDAATGKAGRVLTGHDGTVNGAAFFGDGKRLVTVGADRTARLWDAESGSAGRMFASTEQGRLQGVALTPDEAAVAVGSIDGKIHLWNPVEDEEPTTIQMKRFKPEGNFPLLGMAVSPDGRTIAACGEERGVKVIDSATGQVRFLLEGHEDMVARVVFSPDGKTLASAGFDGRVGLWDVATGKLVRFLDGHSNWVLGVAYSPDGKTLASGGFDRTVRVWDGATGKQLASAEKHKGAVRAVAFSLDGKTIYSAGSDRAIRSWSADKLEPGEMFKGHEDAVRDLAISPDGTRMVTCGEDMLIKLWELPSGKELVSRKLTAILRAVTFSPFGKKVVVADEGRAWTLVDAKTLLTEFRLAETTGQGAFTGVAYAPDGKTLYAGGMDNTVRAWAAMATGRRPLLTLPSPGKQMWFAVWSPDGKRLARGGQDRLLEVADARFGLPAGSINELKDSVYGLTLSPDGRTLAVSTGDGVHLYEAATRKHVRTLAGFKERVWAAAFSPDGRQVAAASGSFDNADLPGEVKFFDTADGKELGALSPTASVQAVAWSPDGRTLAVGARDGLCRLYEMPSRKERAVLRGHRDAVRFARFSPDGTLLATAGMDDKIRLWTTADGKEYAQLDGFASGANGVEWSPSGTMLAAVTRPAGTTPGQARVWERSKADGDKPAFKVLHTLANMASPALAVAFSPDGATLVTGGGVYAQKSEVTLYHVRSGRRLLTLDAHKRWVEAVCFLPDGTLVSGGGNTGQPGEVKFTHVPSGGWTKENAAKGELCCAAWSPGGGILAVGTYERDVKLFDGKTGELLGTLNGHRGNLRCVAFSPDGKQLASCADDGTVKVWDVASRTEFTEVCRHAMQVNAVAWSPDGKELATASGHTNSGNTAGTIRVFDLELGKERPASDRAGRGATTLAYSPDGKFLAAGGAGNESLRVFDAKTGKLVKAVAKANSIRCLVWSADGRYVYTAHGTGGTYGNGSVQVFDAATWEEKLALSDHTSLVLGMSLTADGKYLATAANDNTVKVWDAGAEKKRK